MEEPVLLVDVQRTVGGIEIDGDEPNALAQALAVKGQHGVGQRRPQPIEIGPPHGVLEPRQRRLRPRRRALERIALEQQLVDRIVDQPRGVVAVRVATGQPEDALAQQIPERDAQRSGHGGLGVEEADHGVPQHLELLDHLTRGESALRRHQPVEPGRLHPERLDLLLEGAESVRQHVHEQIEELGDELLDRLAPAAAPVDVREPSIANAVGAFFEWCREYRLDRLRSR